MKNKGTTKKPKILLAIINNRDTWPEYFASSMVSLYSYCIRREIDVDLRVFRANDVNHMRNNAARWAMGFNPESIKYTHLIEFDTDHTYPADMVNRLLGWEKEIVCGCTNQRSPPFMPTQYKEFKDTGFKSDENRCFFEGDEGLKEIGSSGVVGALIDVKVFDKLTYPYFNLVYKNETDVIGGDVYFCKQLKDAGIKIYCDASLSYPHAVQAFTDRKEIKL
jgi:hypothetical protein